MFAESWQDSQFWYSDQTATILAEQLLEGITSDSRIAVVSAPSAYVQLRNLLVSLCSLRGGKRLIVVQNDKERYPVRPKLTLFEIDERFEVFKDDFVMYDFKNPLKFDDPGTLKGAFDRIICDPPFLSEDCQSKVRWLARQWQAPQAGSEGSTKLILCTGERMESLAHKLYGKAGLQTTTFLPEHTKGLSNEFRCYANFECDGWKWTANA
ncbi:hypothetical protein BT93_L0198 [Corymbia citriodora subsp. variegata]|uniref:Protein-lysine N-methyltransferase n=1 Tax=Corymbia citriodora subsp. variegata TaxID=360336 RepID=A0A8T0CGN1_CORYI|nr:hypothetical protein BT93_L0198 [Corymbia citriodora subsp. variegata]